MNFRHALLSLAAAAALLFPAGSGMASMSPGCADKPCAECDKCIWACPTRAIKSAGTIDAEKCISYQTIENKGDIPEEIARHIGNKVFGCDKCIEICPYQKFAKEKKRKNKQFKFHPERQNLKLTEILKMDEKQFEKIFGDSSLKRTGLEKIKATIRKCSVEHK